MKRRSFFQSIAKAAAIIALAPQIAFRVRPAVDLLKPLEDMEYCCIMEPGPTLYSDVCVTYCYDQAYIDAYTSWYGQPPYPIKSST